MAIPTRESIADDMQRLIRSEILDELKIVTDALSDENNFIAPKYAHQKKEVLADAHNRLQRSKARVAELEKWCKIAHELCDANNDEWPD